MQLLFIQIKQLCVWNIQEKLGFEVRMLKQVENEDEMFPRFLNSSSVEKEIQR